jgi:F0F1-type ATP synthase membrane subunit c/vacuolar-type H+-ATPase subunit K
MNITRTAFYSGIACTATGVLAALGILVAIGMKYSTAAAGDGIDKAEELAALNYTMILTLIICVPIIIIGFVILVIALMMYLQSR